MRKKIVSIILVMAILAASVFTNGSEGKAATALDVGSSENSVYGAVSAIGGVNFDAGHIKYSGKLAEIRWGIDSSGVFAFYHSDAAPYKRIKTAAGFTPFETPQDVPWYPYRSEIKYITLANLDSFISIGSMDYYFYGCQNLRGVVMLPPAASSMNYTFYNASSLQFFGCTMPVTKRMNSCFQGCRSLNADIVFTSQPDECSNAFLNSPARVIVLAGIYDSNSKLANTSKCREYHATHKQEVTLYGIARTTGKLVDEWQSDSYLTSIRYGQKISDAEYGSTGGVRFAYAYSNSDFLHSVYLSADTRPVMKQNISENEVMDAGVYSNFMDIKLQPIPSSLASYVICPAEFYHSSYKSLVVERCPVEACTIAMSENSFTYDGTAKMPSVTLTNPYNGKSLTKGKDYTVSYQDCVDAGTARLTVTGIGNYTGKVTRTYTIANANLSGSVKVSGYSGGYDGGAHGISVQVTKPANGYTIAYGTSSGNCNLSVSPVYRDAGSYTVYFRISAPNYQTYMGSAVVRIEPKSVAACSVEKIPVRTYNGKAQMPEPVVSDGGKVLKKGTDYTISHANNVDVGTAQVTVMGKGNYMGKTVVSYSIGAASMDGREEKMLLEQENYTYTGKEIHPNVRIWDLEGTLLKESRDYTLTYSNAVNAGTAEVQAVLKGNYKGSIRKSFEIQPVVVTDVILSEQEFIYNGKEHRPLVHDYKEGVDYQISYRDNTDAGTATAVITFQGNYRGTVAKEFIIHTRKVDMVLDFPESHEVQYHDDLTVGESALSVKENEWGRFEWANSETHAVVKNQGYPVRFIPYDTKNYDWSGVEDWDEKEQTVVRTVALTVTKAPGRLTDIRTRALAEGDCLGDSEILWKEDGGKLSWSEPEQTVKTEVSQYLMDFVPYDTENYDWSSIGEWEAKKGVYQISGEVTVIENPIASSIEEGQKLSVSVLSSSQPGAVYEWESPELIVTKHDGKEEQYRVIYRYQGNVLVRKVSVPVHRKPVMTDKPMESDKPAVTGEPKESDRPVETVYPNATETPGVPEKPATTEEPEDTVKLPESETTDITVPLPDNSVFMPEHLYGETSEWEPNAYEVVDRLITEKFFSESESKKKEINAAKIQKIRREKIRIKWLTKRKTTVRIKRKERLKFRIKGVAKKQKIRWHISNKAKMSVNKNGVVKAKKKGRVKLTARVGKKTYVCRIRIRK